MSEYELIKKIQVSNDNKAFEEICLQYNKYIDFFHKYALENTIPIKRHEVEQAMRLGLYEACRRFNVDTGNKLITYASYWIKKYIREYNGRILFSSLDDGDEKDEKEKKNSNKLKWEKLQASEYYCEEQHEIEKENISFKVLPHSLRPIAKELLNGTGRHTLQKKYNLTKKEFESRQNEICTIFRNHRKKILHGNSRFD